jgi:metal-responsive CopG/Arc/MetJ family transcriptional regulator
MARIDIRNLDEETLTKLDEQLKKYGINNRADYIRLLINLDIMTNIISLIKQCNDQ